MNNAIYTIVGNVRIAPLTYEMRLAGDVKGMDRPGQFVNIKIDGLYLRRPISVCDVRDGALTLIYKTVGEGTRALSEMNIGEKLDLLTGLGNGYDISKCPARALLVGGGAGVPPLYLLAKKLAEAGKKPRAILGFNTAEEVFYADKFSEICETEVVTADGRGFVTAAMGAREDYVCACGPEPMLRAVYERCAGGQFSFEERMGCGFGACMGCTCETITGYKRVCRDGPVFERNEILWRTRA